MLGKVKRKVNKYRKSNTKFEELYVNYLLFIQDKNILTEMEYIKKHNDLDVFNLDKWINNSLKKVFDI